MFGVTNALSAAAYKITPENHLESNSLSARVAWRAPLAVVWSWVQLLPLDIANQNSARAVVEDGINKPWRPLPSKQLSPKQAFKIMLGSYLAAVIISVWVGGLRQSLSLVALSIWYDGLAGADAKRFLRHLLNGVGYVCFTSGALEVNLGLAGGLPCETRLAVWFGIVCGTITSTIQLMDMYVRGASDNTRRNSSWEHGLEQHKSQVLGVLYP